jgi:hypothetical protein
MTPNSFRAIMRGANEADVKAAIGEVGRSLERPLLRDVVTDLLGREPRPVRILNIPVLYLISPAAPNVGKEERWEVFRRYVPTARYLELNEFGGLHEEAGGLELADRVIPFIQEAVAQREGSRQT